MHTALLHRSKRLWLLLSMLVLVQPAASAEGNMRKVGIVTVISLDAASRSPAFKRFTDTIRASAPDLYITFEWRSAEGKNERYPQIVADLVQQQVDVIFTGPGPAALAARQVTATVPVVFNIAANPVTLGLVKSLEKPGGNITGLYEERPDFPSKRIALLREMVPQARTIGIIWDAKSWAEPVGSEMARETEKAVLAAGGRAVIVPVKGAEDLERAFSLLKQAQVDGLVVEQGPVFIFQAKKLAELAARAKIPAIYPSSHYNQAGLSSLGPDGADNLQHVADYIGKILNGANPADLPVARSRKALLMVNTKAAKELGIAVAPELRARADTIVE
jgi:putative ABC transport system substrate-binding protein